MSINNKKEIIDMLKIKNGSSGYFDLLAKAYKMSSYAYKNKGYVFGQIGLNAEPCSINCTFCPFGEKHFSLEEKNRKSKDEILKEAKQFLEQGVDEIFLMTTEDYPFNQYIDIAESVREIMPKDMRLICNIGDFGIKEAKKLKETGFAGAYHICRLGEGIDTKVSEETRVATIEALISENLELYYCVEPIGPEHSYEQIADEILRANKYNVNVMAIMRRVPKKGTPKYSEGQIDALEFAKIAAVTRIAVNPERSMNAHETSPMTFLAGVNQLYAESGTNPRDIQVDTQNSRGMTVKNCRQLLADVGYTK